MRGGEPGAHLLELRVVVGLEPRRLPFELYLELALVRLLLRTQLVRLWAHRAGELIRRAAGELLQRG